MRRFVLVMSIAVISASVQATVIDDPFGYFNVYSLNGIGSDSKAYGSDFQGIAGAGGNVHFSGFSLNGMDNQSNYVLHTGGSVKITGSYKGHIEAGGNVSLGSVDVSGDITSLGDVVNFGGGSVHGNVNAKGKIDISQQMSVAGSKNEGVNNALIANHSMLSNYFTSTSQQMAAMESNTKYKDKWGGIEVNANAGINVVNIDADTLNNAWGFKVNGTKNAYVYINVSGKNVNLNSTTWNYTGGIDSGNVILNFVEAETLNLSGGNTVNILAPLADTNFSSGLVTGNLIVADLQGSGQVNLAHFTGGSPVPEPATLAMMGFGGLLLCRIRRKAC